MSFRARVFACVAASSLALASTPVAAQDGEIDAGNFDTALGLPGIDPGAINLNEECGKQIGCIVIANNSDNYRITEIDVNTKTRKDRITRWTNIMNEGSSVGPRKVFLIPRIGDDKLAVVGLRAVLLSTLTHKREVIELGTIDLRPDPAKRLFVNFLHYEPAPQPPVLPGAAAAPANTTK